MYSHATVEKKIVANSSIEETFSSIQKVLSELGLKNLKTKKAVRPSYLLVEYKEGFMAKGEVEFVLQPNQSKTEVSIKWTSPSNDEGTSSDHDNDFGNEAEIVMSVFSSLIGGRKSKHNPQQLIEELKHRLGAAEVSVPIESNITKEIIKEKEVIVKIRCAYCRNLFNETLNKCPTCGAAV